MNFVLENSYLLSLFFLYPIETIQEVLFEKRKSVTERALSELLTRGLLIRKRLAEKDITVFVLQN